MTAANVEAQKLAQDARVYLYEIDCTKYGGPTLRWTPGPVGDTGVTFNSIYYQPVPIQIEGAEWNGQGPLPRPRVAIPNVNAFATQLMAAYGDLLGCRVSRIWTYFKFTSTGSSPDGTAYFGPEEWFIDRVANRSRDAVVFELASSLDIQGKKLPGRQVIRDTCSHVYRIYKGSAFVQGTCPWAGSAIGNPGPYYKADGTSTSDPNEDACGKRVVDCWRRFYPQGWGLRTLAFPAASKVQY